MLEYFGDLHSWLLLIRSILLFRSHPTVDYSSKNVRMPIYITNNQISLKNYAKDLNMKITETYERIVHRFTLR